MTNRNLTILIVLALVAFTAFFVWWGSNRHDWSESNAPEAYVRQSKEPYGLMAMHRLMESYFEGRKLVDIKSSTVKELPIDSTSHKNYIFIGEATSQDSLELAHLLDFVAAGNTAFMSSKSLPGELTTALYFEDCDDYEWVDYEQDNYATIDTFNVRLFQNTEIDYPFFYSVKNSTHAYAPHYIPSEIFYCESPDTYQSLGYVEEDFKINFAVFPYGKGEFYVHSTPIAFTNYHLLRADGQAYCQKILNHIPNGDIYWDAYSQTTEMEGRRQNLSKGFNRKLPPSNPLSTLLTDRNLAWAWYLSLALGLLFIVFKGKRRQRTIPILPKNNNTSMEFIETIAQLHFKEKNYQGIAIQRMRLFLAFLRERYGVQLLLSTEHYVLFKTETLAQLSSLSEIPASNMESIISQYHAMVDYAPTDEMLVDFYQAIEAFRLQAK